TTAHRSTSDASAPSRRSRGFSARSTSLCSSRSARTRIRASARPVSRIGSSRTGSPCAAKPSVTAGVVASSWTVWPRSASPRAMLARLVPEPLQERAEVRRATRNTTFPLPASRSQLRLRFRGRERRETGGGRSTRAEVDPRGLHRTDIGGVEQRLLNLVCIPAVRHPHVGGDEKNRGAEAVLAEQRQGNRAVRAVAVVEGNDDGPPGKQTRAATVGEVVGERGARVAAPRQERELRLELLGRDVVPRVPRPRRDAVDFVVQEDRQFHASTS